MTWFEELTNLSETNPEEVRKNITVTGESLKVKSSGKTLTCGRLETPSLSELRARVQAYQGGSGFLSLSEVVGDAQQYHTDPVNAGALFQVASQFNLLEMTSPNVTPEQGIGIYENDRTQGPACAVAAGAGTIYRNYFAPVKGQIGQSAHNQIDCLADLGKVLGNDHNRLWQMKNGYALATRAGLEEISELLRSSSEAEIDELRKLVRVGLQWNTQVTLNDCAHLVSQAYCSALPVAYCAHPLELWEGFARLVLEAAYEAALCAAVINSRNTGNNRVFLTLLGGGVFGNPLNWILEALRRALRLFAARNIAVEIISFRQSNPRVQELVHSFTAERN